MSKPWHKLVISLEPGELELLAAEARRVRLPVDIYVKHAALSAAENAAANSPYTPQKLIAIHSAAANRGQVWTEEELRERRLPLYWSRDWLLAQLSQGKSYSDIAMEHGYKVATVRQYSRRYHGIKFETRANQHNREEAAKRAAMGASKVELAQELGMSVQTVRKWLRSEGDNTRKLKQRIEAAGPWPASVSEIAQRMFGGNHQAARAWLSDTCLAGHLVRVRRGVYDKAQTESKQPLARVS